MNKRTVIIVCIIATLLCLAVGANFYFMYYLNAEEGQLASVRALENMIRHKIRHLKPAYLNRNPRFFMFRNKLLKNYKLAAYENASVLWEIANWVGNQSTLYVYRLNQAKISYSGHMRMRYIPCTTHQWVSY